MMNRKVFFTLGGLFFLGFLLSCRTPKPIPELPPPPPAPEQSPRASLFFDTLEGQDIRHITLYFHLEAENPRAAAARMVLGDWKVLMNGLDVRAGAVLTAGKGEESFPLSGASAEAPPIPVKLELDLSHPVFADFAGPGYAGLKENQVRLALYPDFIYGAASTVPVRAEADAVFPQIREPVFTITAITVQKAELINTRFKVSLRVDNPNFFPVELSSLDYELYGDGRFWAGGKEQEILLVAPGNSAETSLSFVMNFINMRRELLDQVIALKEVNYRFTGEALVTTGISYLPQFLTRFDRSGLSEVVE
jgi:LEA14-like dessication related protein